MNILVTTDRGYIQHLYAMLVSLLENNAHRPITLYYIYYGIDDTSLSKFERFFSQKGLAISLIQADTREFSGLFTSRYITPAAYLRLRCPDLLPSSVHRILYLDPDIIIRKPLDELYETDLGDCYIAAVESGNLGAVRIPALGIPSDSKYFNSGVALIDVDAFRREKISERTMDFAKKMGAKLDYYDQDALNAILYDTCLYLHPTWNVHSSIFRISPEDPRRRTQEICDAIADPAVVHFSGPPKPWEYGCNSPFKEEYWRYLRKTPYKRFRPIGFKYEKEIRKFVLDAFVRYTPRPIKDAVPSRYKNWIISIIRDRW